MDSYFDLLEYIPENRRRLAYDLAEQLDAINQHLRAFAVCMENNSGALDDPEEQKLYFALMRTFLATLKQFERLLPPVSTEQATDALTEFNAASVYDERGLVTV